MKKLLLLTFAFALLNNQSFASDDEEYDSSSDTVTTEQEVAPESSQVNPNWYQNQEGSTPENMEAPSGGDEEVIDDSSDY